MVNIDKIKCEDVSTTLKAVAHPQRLRLLCLLTQEEKNVNSLAEECEISQSQMSQFLTRLQREGIVSSRKDKGLTYYSISDKKIYKLIQSLHKIFADD